MHFFFSRIRRERGNSAHTWYWHFDTLLLLWYFVDILVPDVDTFQVVDIKVWCPYQGIIWSQMQGIATILKFDTFVLEIRFFMKMTQMVSCIHNTFHFMRNSTLSVMKDLSKFSSTTWVITIPICTWKKTYKSWAMKWSKLQTSKGVPGFFTGIWKLV